MARRNTFEVDETLESPFSFKHLKRAMKYIGRHKGKMGLALLLSAVASVVALFQPKIMQWVLDDAVPGKNVTLLLWLALAYVGIILVSILFSTIRSRIMAHVSQEIIYDIRKDLFAHLQRLPFSYYDSRPAGKILVRVINYVNSVSDMLSNGIINSILEILNILFIVVFMYATNAVLATIIVAGLPVFAGVIWFLKPRQRKAWQRQSNKNSNYNAYLAESIDGVKVSQLFARQEENLTVMERLAAACRKAWMGAVYISNSVWLSSELITQIVFTLLYIAGVYWLGGRHRLLRRHPGDGAVRQPVLAAHHQPREYLQFLRQQHRLSRTDLRDHGRAGGGGRRSKRRGTAPHHRGSGVPGRDLRL